MVLRFGRGQAFSVEVGARELFATLPGRVEVYAWVERRASFRFRRTRTTIDCIRPARAAYRDRGEPAF